MNKSKTGLEFDLSFIYQDKQQKYVCALHTSQKVAEHLNWKSLLNTFLSNRKQKTFI